MRRAGLLLMALLRAASAHAEGDLDEDCVHHNQAPTDLGTASDEEAMPPAPPAPAPTRTPAPTPPPLTVVPPTVASGEEWPIAYVLRPQTLPSGWVRATLVGGAFIPTSVYGPSGQGQFHGFATFGGGLAVGGLDRWQFNVGLPKVVCVDTAKPSGCSGYNRNSGSGFGLSYAALRRRVLKLRIASSATTVLSDPFVMSVGVSSRAKWLVADWLALEGELGLSKWLAPPEYYREHLVALTWSTLDLNFQITRHLLFFADAQLFAPRDQVSHPSLQCFAGGSWTFAGGTEIHLGGSTSNVLPRRAMDTSVPGKSVGLSLSFWI